MQETYRLIAIGKVQGVWYRATVKQIADKMGIFGTVKNLPNGNVEIIANLEGQNRLNFINELYKGSIKSDVEDIESEKIFPICLFSNFQIIY